MVRRTIAKVSSRLDKERAVCEMFSQVFCGVLSRIVILCALQTSGSFFILLQRGIAIFDCEAAALPGRFLPELGRSSERPFFWLVFCVLRASRSRSWAFKPTSLLRSCSGHKIPSQKPRMSWTLVQVARRLLPKDQNP